MNYIDAYAHVCRGYDYDANDGVGFFRSHALSMQSGLRHGFTARVGGVSLPPYDSLNLGWSRDEPCDNIEANFMRLCKSAGLDYKTLTLVSYEHGTRIERVTKRDCGRGMNDFSPLPPCDAIITNEKGVTLVTSHADCAAVFLFDPEKKAIGLAHAGWRGVLGRIGQGMAVKMGDEFGCSPKSLMAAVGPCICQACFEVDEALGLQFDDEFKGAECVISGKESKLHVDIEKALCAQLLDFGLLPQNITLMNACTVENEPLLFSYRRDKGMTGSMAAYMAIM